VSSLTAIAPAGVDEKRVERVRLSAVSYLNAAPLLYGLETEQAFELERAVPARVAERLHAGEADLGMIPSIEYARGRYAIVPEIAIASRSAVRSVMLFFRTPLVQVRRVALDTGSRTSVALLRLLLRERIGRDPEYVDAEPYVDRMLETSDAALVIGDVALYYEGSADRLDLGQAWRQATGLPFVWAFWAGRSGALNPAGVARLQRATREGVEAIPQIAETFAAGDPDRAELNASYLLHSIAYEMGEKELAGLAEFYRRAAAAGLITAIPEIRFHGDR
jgi:chorismate dehydratase